MTADVHRLADTANMVQETAYVEKILREGDPLYEPGGGSSAWDRLMHPGVGPALADLLDMADLAARGREYDGSDWTDELLKAAFAVARALRGEET